MAARIQVQPRGTRAPRVHIGASNERHSRAPVVRDDNRVLAPSKLELILLFSALLVGAAVHSAYESATTIANFLLPGILTIALTYGNYRMAVTRVSTILTPTFAARTAMIFYGGIGSIVHYYASEETLHSIFSFYAFDEREVLKYNLVVILFALMFTASGPILNFVVGNLRIFKTNQRVNRFGIIERSNLSIVVIGTIFIIIGTIANLFFVLPTQLGLIESNFPVIVFQLSNSAYIGVFLCTIWCLQNKPSLTWVFVGLGMMYSLVGMATFAKTEVILPVIMLVAAFVYVKPKMRTLLWSAAVVVSVFYVSQPITSFGRLVLANTYGSITGPASLSERAAIIGQYFDGSTTAGFSDENAAFARFSYVNVGTYVINSYDSGFPGTTLESAYAVFIPRIIWPNKPILTEAARELNFEVTGNDQSSVATGLAAEAYWNAGWIGVVVAALAVGTIFWFWSIYALRVQSAGAWHLFPVLLLGVRAGTRFDGFFVVDVLGPLLFAVLGHVALMMANRLIYRFRRS